MCAETTDGAKIMAPKLWRQRNACVNNSLIDYHRSDILPSNVERLCIVLCIMARSCIPSSIYAYGYDMMMAVLLVFIDIDVLNLQT